MSDYLTNLIARSFSSIEVIQPRLASRFESPQQLGEPIVEQFFELEQEDSVSPFPSSSLNAPRLSSNPNLLSQSSNTDLRPLPSIQLEVGEQVVAPPMPEQPVLEPIEQQRFVEQFSIPVETAPTVDSSSEFPLVSEARVPPQISPVMQPQIVPLPAPVKSSVSQEKAAPPTINVTIGRIDVRATTTSSPSRQPTKPPTPNLSLEDYLNARRGGRG